MAVSALAPLTVGRAFAAWRPDPVGLVLAVVLVGGYVWAWRRAALRGRSWSIGRGIVFLGLGVGSLLIATVGWVGVYAHALLWVFTIQVLVLLLLTPSFLALGRPLSLLRLADIRPGWHVPRPLAALNNPLVGPALVPVITAAVFFSPLLDAALHYAVIQRLLWLLLVTAGFLFALPLAGEGAPQQPLAVAAATFIGFLELLVDAIPGMVLRLRTHLVTDYFALRPHGWGPSALSDQRIAGAILWGVAETIDLPFLALLVVQWIRADEREAALVDRQLDEAERAAATAGAQPTDRPAQAPEPADQPAPALTRPWWESDPSVFGSRRGAAYRRDPPSASS